MITQIKVFDTLGDKNLRDCNKFLKEIGSNLIKVDTHYDSVNFKNVIYVVIYSELNK